MLHIFHGEHIEASRKELNALRQRLSEYELVNLDGRTATLTDLIVATESQSLFGEKRLVVVENFFKNHFGKTAKAEEKQKYEIWLKGLPDNIELVFWEEKELGKTILSLLPKQADVAVFKPDKNLFLFVESIKPGQTQKLLLTLYKVLSEESAEFVFAMLVRQLRMLLMVKTLERTELGLPSWQAGKLVRQAEAFSLQQLLSLYHQLLDIDVTIKNGTSVFNLRQRLEQFIVSLA